MANQYIENIRVLKVLTPIIEVSSCLQPINSPSHATALTPDNKIDNNQQAILVYPKPRLLKQNVAHLNRRLQNNQHLLITGADLKQCT